jgi:hypothetical protein
LTAFFRHEAGFFLSGGAALAGFHLGHRETGDLDLFATSDILERGEMALRAVARDLGASVENIQTAPEFRRRLVKREPESVVVDLVWEQVPQVIPDKPVIGGIRVDPAEEILANKLCALLSRSEIRDLVDVYALEKSGLRVEDALAAAARKDAGLTPAQLSWVLSEITIGPDAQPPGGVSADELRRFLSELVERLSRLAYPGTRGQT